MLFTAPHSLVSASVYAVQRYGKHALAIIPDTVHRLSICTQMVQRNISLVVSVIAAPCRASLFRYRRSRRTSSCLLQQTRTVQNCASRKKRLHLPFFPPVVDELHAIFMRHAGVDQPASYFIESISEHRPNNPSLWLSWCSGDGWPGWHGLEFNDGSHVTPPPSWFSRPARQLSGFAL